MMRVDSFYSLQRQINYSKKRLDRVLNQLAENKRITSAKDDIAGTAVIGKLKATLNSLKSANEKNISQGESLLDIAYDATMKINDKRKELLALATEAANPLTTANRRTELQLEFKQGVLDLDELAKTTTFNGKSLLDGSLNVDLQTGSEAGQTLKLKLDSLTADSLNIDGLAIDSVLGAEKAAAHLKSLSSRVDHVFSQINAQTKSLDFRQSSNVLQIENLEEARSKIEDLDIPAATVELSLQESLYESRAALLASSLSTQENVFDLLWRRSR